LAGKGGRKEGRKEGRGLLSPLCNMLWFLATAPPVMCGIMGRDLYALGV
jgi:hypothetical protein